MIIWQGVMKWGLDYISENLNWDKNIINCDWYVMFPLHA